MNRRQYLAGLGSAAVAGLAGCSTLERLGESEPARLEASALDGWTPPEIVAPSSLPVTVPASLRTRHEERARSLLDRVPANPEIPNGAVRSSVVSERELVLERLSTGSAADRSTELLRDWRWTRGEAANVYGMYRAATGTDDAARIDRRRESIREALAELRSDLEYRAATPIEAVVIYAPIEELLRDADRRSRPRAQYPDPPVADVDRAGDRWQSLERAEAALEDVRGLRETYLDTVTDQTTQWAHLADRARDVEYSVDRSRSERLEVDPRDDPETAFGMEIDGVGRELFRVASRELRFREEEPRDHRRDGRYGAAILEAGRALASIAAMDAVVTGVRNGALPTEQSRESVTESARHAHDTIQGTPTNADYPFLAAGLLEPALSAYGTAVRSVGEYFDPLRAEANFRYAALSGAAALEAATFVADHLSVNSG